MRSPIEVVNHKLILPLSELRTEFGLAFIYFGLLLGIKASEILDNPWLLGLWVMLLLETLFLDLSRPGIRPQFHAENTKNSTQGANGRRRKTLLTLWHVGITLSLGVCTLLLLNFSEAFFFRVESRLRVIHYGDNFVNWILLSIIIVTTHLLGALVSLRKTDTAPYARLFPIIAIGIVYIKGVLS